MRLSTLIVVAIILGIGLGAVAAQNPTVFRDAQGRTTGTATNNRDGTTTFRDASGRQTGTATNNRDGTTTFRDAQGRLTGTSTKR